MSSQLEGSHEDQTDNKFGRTQKRARGQLLRRTGAGRRECVLRGRCRNQIDRRDGVRMQCNTVAGHPAKGIVLRLTQRAAVHRYSRRQPAVQETYTTPTSRSSAYRMHTDSYAANGDRVLCQNCVRWPLKPQADTVICRATLMHIVVAGSRWWELRYCVSMCVSTRERINELLRLGLRGQCNAKRVEPRTWHCAAGFYGDC